MSTMREEWRPVPATDGRYEVSSRGRIRRVNRRVLKPQPNKRGYQRVPITVNRKARIWFLHRLIALVFIGDCPPGYQVNHIDSDPANNAPSNLEYVTPQGNQAHSWATNNRQPPHKGERTHFAKLTEQNVIRIRRLRREGLTYAAIASQFNSKPANIWHICAGHTWKHLL
jgi:hypothetical protein